MPRSKPEARSVFQDLFRKSRVSWSRSFKIIPGVRIRASKSTGLSLVLGGIGPLPTLTVPLPILRRDKEDEKRKADAENLELRLKDLGIDEELRRELVGRTMVDLPEGKLEHRLRYALTLLEEQGK